MANQHCAGFSARLWDVHAHAVPPGVIAAAKDERFGLRLDGDRLLLPGGGLPLNLFAKPGAIIERLDESGLYGAVLSVPPLLYRYDLTGREARAWADFVNEQMQEVLALAPARLRGLATVPADGEDAAHVLEKTLAKPWAGLTVGSMVGPFLPDDPALHPLYEAADAVGRYIFIHPVEPGIDPRLNRYYLNNLLGNPLETSLAAACLIFSGVLDKFPNIRFGLAHAGGATPFLAGRWQRGRDTSRPGIPAAAVPPLEGLRRLWYDTIAFSDGARRLLLDMVGPEQMLLGSDYPFPMQDPDPGASVASLGPGALQQIGGLNPVRTLGI